MLGQDLSVSRAVELSTALGVEDKSLRGTTSAKSHAQSSDGEGGVEDLAHGPANYSPGEDIEDRDEIQPALSGEDGSGIADPDLIGASNCDVGEWWSGSTGEQWKKVSNAADWLHYRKRWMHGAAT